MYVGERYY